MALTKFEREILHELKIVTGNSKLEEKDMLEWRTRKTSPRENEKIIYLSRIGIYVSIPTTMVSND